jgi:hypothetical protein
MVTLIILPSRTSGICCLDCAFLCILTHRLVISTTPSSKNAHFVPTVEKEAELFLSCFNAVREHGIFQQVDSLTNPNPRQNNEHVQILPECDIYLVEAGKGVNCSNK